MLKSTFCGQLQPPNTRLAPFHKGHRTLRPAANGQPPITSCPSPPMLPNHAAQDAVFMLHREKLPYTCAALSPNLPAAHTGQTGLVSAAQAAQCQVGAPGPSRPPACHLQLLLLPRPPPRPTGWLPPQDLATKGGQRCSLGSRSCCKQHTQHKHTHTLTHTHLLTHTYSDKLLPSA